MAVTAWHYDGRSAIRRRVELRPEGDGFVLVEGDAAHGPFAWSDLTGRGMQDGAAVYAHRTLDGWRLGLDGEIPPDIAARLPREERYGRLIDRIGLWKASAAFAVIAVLALTGVYFAPAAIAPLIPPSFERRMGDAMVGDFGGRFCAAPEGQAALAKLVRRIDPEGGDLDVRVANIGMVNAVALPGGKIIIFDQLLREAESPDEVAGVLGHEIGHVRNRDVMQALLRQLGLSVVLGGVQGDAGGYLNAVIGLTYTRAAEARADGYAIESLRMADVSPVATAAFFRRLARFEPGDGRAATMLGYVSSHPLSRARERTFRAAAEKGANYTPALTTEEWIALRRICRDDPKAARDDSFGPF
ncbi:peptidase [Sphingomonas gilva]|uniref:Peptidase n=1 Tax=Sphingomonas gilva TaxID=2305907 RepID=A0A396RZ27_9SPHN|nr:M48 family metallopeptidase [Sphingomonas gilva]RHW18991.1 peptidase [Sphingomonas gilva]